MKETANMQNYTTLTFQGNSPDDSEYRVEFQRPVPNVKELSLVYFDSETEQPTVPDGRNTLSFGTGWRVPPGKQFNVGRDTIYVPPYLNPATVTESSGYWVISMKHEASVGYYLNNMPTDIPSLTLIATSIATSSTTDDPNVYLTSANQTSPTTFKIHKTSVPPSISNNWQNGQNVFVHRIAWQKNEWDLFTKGKLSFEGPMQTVSIPPGIYDANSILTVVPEALHVGYLPQNETFVVREGISKTVSCTVPAGHYPTPAIFAQALTQALVGTDVVVRFDSPSFVFSQSTPFLLDFSGTTSALHLALGVQNKVYGPFTRFQTDVVQFSGQPYVYTLQQDNPNVNRFCLQAMYPPVIDITTRIIPRNQHSILWLPTTIVLPYQEDDVVFIKTESESHTVRVRQRGNLFTTSTPIPLNTTVTDDDGRVAVVIATGGQIVYLISDSSTLGDVTYDSQTLKPDSLGYGYVVDVPTDSFPTDNTTFVCSTGFIDPPRFEMEATPGLAHQLGLRTRLSGNNIYSLPRPYAFRALPYIYLYVEPLNNGLGSVNRQRVIIHSSGEERTPLGKLVSEGSQFQLQRLENFEHVYHHPGRIGGVRWWFEYADGTRVLSLGGHTLTLGFLSDDKDR
jgi:hypothetical protein